jgi:hypothetical protein
MCIDYLMEPVMSHRINVILDDEVWEQLKEVPQGERSLVINQALQALQENLLKRRRQQAFARVLELAKTLEPLPGGAEAWIRADRDSHK